MAKKQAVEELGYGEPNCKKCKLRGRQRIDGFGLPTASIWLVFNAPSTSTVRYSTPFADYRGKFLQNTLMPQADIDLDDCYLTFACQCAVDTGKVPTALMWRSCQPRLLAELEYYNPAWVMILGEAAQQALLPGYSLVRYHGKALMQNNRTYVIMYDPKRAKDSTFMQQLILNDFINLPATPYLEEVKGHYLINNDASVPLPLGECLVCIDTETVGLYGKLLGGSISLKPETATYHTPQSLIKWMNIYSKDQRLLFHNAKYDLRVLLDNGWKGQYKEVEDTQVLAYCMAYPNLKLKVLETQELNLTHPDYDSMVEDGTLEDVPLEETAQYCSQDTDATMRLWRYLIENADEQERYVYETIEKPLIPVLADMERLGTKCDLEYVRQWRGELVEERDVLERQLLDDFDLMPDFLNSAQKLGNWLVDQGLRLPKTRKSKQYITGKEVLTGMQDQHPSITPILRRKQLNKLISTYADACLELADADDIIHTNWNQTRVVTGRLSSSEPNLQNLPYMYAARRPFVARPGNKLLGIDYSQVDMRVLAVIANDPELLEAFARGDDIHDYMAIKLFGDASPMHRHIIKSASYLTIYGGTAKSLHIYLNAPMGEFDLEKMGTPPSIQECQGLIDSYFIKFPRLGDYHEETKAFAQCEGYVEDYYGRRRYLPNVNSRNPRVFASAMREAINFPIASTAGGIFKLSIIAAAKVWIPIMNIHDELIFDIPIDLLDDLTPKLQVAMEGLDFPVPLMVKCKTGDNLGELI